MTSVMIPSADICAKVLKMCMNKYYYCYDDILTVPSLLCWSQTDWMSLRIFIT